MFPNAPGGGAVNVRTMMSCSEWHCILLSFFIVSRCCFLVTFSVDLGQMSQSLSVDLSKQPAFNFIDQVCLVVSASLILTFFYFLQFHFVFSFILWWFWLLDWELSLFLYMCISWCLQLRLSPSLVPLASQCGFASCCCHCYSFLNLF